MRTVIWFSCILVASLTLSAAASEIGVEKPSKDIVDGLLKAPSAETIFIADGHAELILQVRVADSVTRKPISHVKVSAVRDRRVSRHLGRSYTPLPTRITDDRGRATLKGEFPMAASADGASVFVLNSYIAVQGPGYVAARSRLSPIYRLDFPRGAKRYEVPIQIALKLR